MFSAIATAGTHTGEIWEPPLLPSLDFFLGGFPHGRGRPIDQSAAVAVEREHDLGALREGIPMLLRLKGAGKRRRKGGIEGAQRGEAMALEVECEGLED
ncbi:hypothetical protein ABZP36_030544 [Zizania latifolia]